MPFKNLEHDSLQQEEKDINRRSADEARTQAKEAKEKADEAIKEKKAVAWLSPSNPYLWTPIDADDF